MSKIKSKSWFLNTSIKNSSNLNVLIVFFRFIEVVRNHSATKMFFSQQIIKKNLYIGYDFKRKFKSGIETFPGGLKNEVLYIYYDSNQDFITKEDRNLGFYLNPNIKYIILSTLLFTIHNRLQEFLFTIGKRLKLSKLQILQSAKDTDKATAATKLPSALYDSLSFKSLERWSLSGFKLLSFSFPI